MEIFLLWRRWAGRGGRVGSGWFCGVGWDFQGDLVGIDLQWILQLLFVMCFVSLCILNFNRFKLNYRDQIVYILIKMIKYCIKFFREILVFVRMGLVIREEGEGVFRRIFDQSRIGFVFFVYKMKFKWVILIGMYENLNS